MFAKQHNKQDEVNAAVNKITGIIEKYTDYIELLDIIDIVDNLRVIVESIDKSKTEHKAINVA